MHEHLTHGADDLKHWLKDPGIESASRELYYSIDAIRRDPVVAAVDAEILSQLLSRPLGNEVGLAEAVS